MDEVFNDWVRTEAHAKRVGVQSDTVVLTWHPIITPWQALKILVLGAKAGRVHITTIKVEDTGEGCAKLRILQQPDFEVTETQLMDSLAHGRSVKLDVEHNYAQCGQSVAPPGWWCQREKGHDGPCAAMTIEEAVATRRAPSSILGGAYSSGVDPR
jgi:hypothetical protein